MQKRLLLSLVITLTSISMISAQERHKYTEEQYKSVPEAYQSTSHVRELSQMLRLLDIHLQGHFCLEAPFYTSVKDVLIHARVELSESDL